MVLLRSCNLLDLLSIILLLLYAIILEEYYNNHKLSFQLNPIRDHLRRQEAYESAYRVLLSWCGLILSDA